MNKRTKTLYEAAVSALIAAAVNNQNMAQTLTAAMNAHNATQAEINTLAPMLAKFMDSIGSNPALAKEYVQHNRPNSVVMHVAYVVGEDGEDWNVTRLPDPNPDIQSPGWYSSMSVYVPGAANSVLVHLYWTGGNPGDSERANVETQIMRLIRLEPEIGSRLAQ